MSFKDLNIRLFDNKSSSKDSLLKISNTIGAACFLIFVPFHLFVLKSYYLAFTSLIVGCFILFNAFILSRYKNFEYTMNLTLAVGFLQILNLSFLLGASTDPGLCWYIFFLAVCITLMSLKSTLFWTVLTLCAFPLLYFLQRTPLSLYQIYLTEEQWLTTNLLNYYAFILACALLFFFFSSAVHKSYDEVKKTKEFLTELIRIIGHDINNPLTIISGHIELLEENPKLDALHLKNISTIKTEIELIQDVTNRVRDWKALETGKKQIQLNIIQLAGTYHRALEVVTRKARFKSITIKNPIIDEELYILGDSDTISYQIIAEIVDNAIKYSFPKSEISISLVVNKETIDLFVKDKGIGIAEKNIKNMMNFERNCLRKGTRGEEGAGFALPLAMVLLEKMGGQIKIKSKEISDVIEYGTEVQLSFIRKEHP